ncbi:MAG TPA: ATP-binding protein [Candidatus Acidoferrum sp.]
MSETDINSQIARFVSDLRSVSTFADLPEGELIWLAQHMDEVSFRAGEVYGRPGDPIEHLVVIAEGEVQFERPEKPGSPVITASAGQITGLLPFSRLTNFTGIGRAVLSTRMLRLHKQNFPELMQKYPELAQRLVGVMSDRIRDIARLENQRDKLISLGKLSAGLAHELNNPAAAARRAAQNLMGAMNNVRAASKHLMVHSFSDEQREAALQFELKATERASARSEAPADPLEVSDREEQITSWLEGHNVSKPWEIAPVLAEVGLNADELDSLVAAIGPDVVGHVVRRVAALITVFSIIKEIDNSTRRITDLVTAIKRYSYMDQAPLQEVDLHEDLENTLKIFGHRLKKGVTVNRQYDPQLPRVCAYGGELNQVWTNLIDNAIDAMDGNGELLLHTAHDPDGVSVEIGDNGPGVPVNIQSQIFDPFFTTKKVGEGTGLGLDTVARIVRKHHGRITLKSKPGDTRFRVWIPFDQPRPQNNSQEGSNNE